MPVAGIKPEGEILELDDADIIPIEEEVPQKKAEISPSEQTAQNYAMMLKNSISLILTHETNPTITINQTIDEISSAWKVDNIREDVEPIWDRVKQILDELMKEEIAKMKEKHRRELAKLEQEQKKAEEKAVELTKKYHDALDIFAIRNSLKLDIRSEAIPAPARPGEEGKINNYSIEKASSAQELAAFINDMYLMLKPDSTVISDLIEEKRKAGHISPEGIEEEILKNARTELQHKEGEIRGAIDLGAEVDFSSDNHITPVKQLSELDKKNLDKIEILLKRVNVLLNKKGVE